MWRITTQNGALPCHDEQKLYEAFLLETFQAGLSWECILNKRENFRKSYDGFDIDKICTYDDAKIEELMQNIGITTSPLSDNISADLCKRGMRIVGTTTIYPEFPYRTR